MSINCDSSDNSEMSEISDCSSGSSDEEASQTRNAIADIKCKLKPLDFTYYETCVIRKG